MGTLKDGTSKSKRVMWDDAVIIKEDLSESRFFDGKSFKESFIGFISDPLESWSGYHILKLEDKRGEFVQFEDQWQSRHILLIPSAIRTEDDTELELNNIRQRVIDGESFESLAKEFSEDPGSALQGGDLGWLGLGVLAEEFEATMLEMEIGEISPVFQTEFGFHFLEVLAKRSHELTDDLIKDRAYSILYARKFDEELENTLRSMRAEAFVEFKDLDWKKLSTRLESRLVLDQI